MKIEENTIICADCMDVLPLLPDGYADLLLTDPPYGDGGGEFANVGRSVAPDSRFEKYRNGEKLGTHLRSGGATKRKYEDGSALVKRIGGTWASKFEKKIVDWDKAPSQDVFDQMFRVSKKQIIWGGNYFALPPTRCFNVWRKLTISETFSMAMCEYAWTSFNANAKFWEFCPQDPTRFHPTAKPIGLICRQLEEYTKEGDLVIDPFSGSGTTAVACHLLGRRFLCIEKDEQYWEASMIRLEEARSQGLLFEKKQEESKQMELEI